MHWCVLGVSHNNTVRSAGIDVMDHKRLWIIMAVVIGASVGISTFTHLKRSGSTEETLVQTSNELNARLPLNVDSDTRWDSTVPGPGKCLTYYYTFVNLYKTEINRGEVSTKANSKLLLAYRTSPDMKLFRENRVTVRYIFKDKAGEIVTSVEASPDDL